jgi:AcrR family transcriptional regulator
MTPDTGLRARKKQQTRRAIGETATRLFAARGFDAVTVSEVARAAGVSEGTVFNYFPRKEDLFYSQMEAFEDELVEAVRTRPPHEAVLPAFRRFILDRSRGLGDAERAETIAAAARIIQGSPALQAREREILATATQALAEAIAGPSQTGPASLEAWVVANALMGVQRALAIHVREAVLGGIRGPALAASVLARATRAFARLEHGLADYSPRRRG